MKKKGSMTIELSLLMPFIIGIIILIIFLSFYLHDSCVVERVGYSCLLNGVNSDKTSEEIVNDFYNEIEGSLLCRWDINFDVSFMGTNAVALVTGRMLPDSQLMFGIISGSVFRYSTKFSVNFLSEAEYIWN
ncbi:MAG: hypothetical protein Q4E51_00105 [Lachnospiraceae bacterium]|nr:hypothetical protein [Lachnospiraceae bacterium]